MGALNPISLLGAATQVLPVITTASQLASQVYNLSGGPRRELRDEQEMALRQLQERQRLDMQQNESQATLERQKLAEQAALDEESRREALRRAVARQRAQFGGSGISSSGGGSAQAVLLGLFEESDSAREERERLDGLRTQALDLSLQNQRSINVLQRSQLEDRQKLQRLYY